MAATIKDVARESGVSVCTVSRVLNNTYRNKVSEETRQRVLDVSKKLGYRPSLIARGLKGKTTNLVGLVVPDIAASFVANTLMGIQSVAEDYGYSILVYATLGNPQKDIDYLRILQEKRVDGILWLPLNQPIHEVFEEVANDLHVLQIYNHLEGLKAPALLVNQFKGGYMATDYLIKKGHQRIAHFSAANVTDMHGVQRLTGYKEALKTHNINPDEQIIIETGYHWDGGYKAAERLLKLPAKKRPTALFASTDMVAWGAIKRFKQAGLSIPDDIAVVGYDDIYIADKIDPPLTTISQPKEKLGQVAMDIMLQAISGEPMTSMLFDPELIVRCSS